MQYESLALAREQDLDTLIWSSTYWCDLIKPKELHSFQKLPLLGVSLLNKRYDARPAKKLPSHFKHCIMYCNVYLQCIGDCSQKRAPRYALVLWIWIFHLMIYKPPWSTLNILVDKCRVENHQNKKKEFVAVLSGCFRLGLRPRTMFTILLKPPYFCQNSQILIFEGPLIPNKPAPS